MFGQIDHTAEIATCAYFFGFQRTDKVNRNYFSPVKNNASFPQEITRTSQTYRRQNQSVCPACCAFNFFLGMHRKCAQYYNNSAWAPSLNHEQSKRKI